MTYIGIPIVLTMVILVLAFRNPEDSGNFPFIGRMIRAVWAVPLVLVVWLAFFAAAYFLK